MAGGITTDIADFSELLAALVPVCPDFLRQRAIRQALIQFCRQTRTWRKTVTDVLLMAGDREKDANRLARRVSVQAVALEVNDIFLTETQKPLRRYSTEELDRNFPGWQAATSDQPRGFLVQSDRTIRFYPAMADDADDLLLDVELVLIPTLAIETVPDFIYQFHAEAIIHASAHRLMAEPNTPWTDPKMSAYFMGAERAGIATAREEAAKRAVDALNAKNRRFFR